MIARTVQDFLRIDEDGKEDLLDAARSVAIGAIPSERSSLVIEAVRVLPSSLLRTFIEGVVTSVEISDLDEVLLDALPAAREISSGAVIVHFLEMSCAMPRVEITRRLQDSLSLASSDHAKNVIGYAMSGFWDVPKDEKA